MPQNWCVYVVINFDFLYVPARSGPVIISQRHNSDSYLVNALIQTCCDKIIMVFTGYK